MARYARCFKLGSKRGWLYVSQTSYLKTIVNLNGSEVIFRYTFIYTLSESSLHEKSFAFTRMWQPAIPRSSDQPIKRNVYIVIHRQTVSLYPQLSRRARHERFLKLGLSSRCLDCFCPFWCLCLVWGVKPAIEDLVDKEEKKLATVVEGDPKAPFSIGTTPRCRGGHYSYKYTLTFDHPVPNIVRWMVKKKLII